VGLIGTSAFASSSNWTEVKALFDHQMKVTIHGETPQQDLTPLIVDGTAYLPVRELGDALGMNVVWNEQQYRIDIEPKQVDEATETLSGIVMDVREGTNGTRLV